MTTDTDQFAGSQKFLHWLMAICIITMLFVGVGMVSTVKPKYLDLVTFHKSLGIALLVLVVIRLGLRLTLGAPPLPLDLPTPMKLAAKLSHWALYALMIVMPLLGWAMLSAANYPIVLLGGFRLPPILAPDASLHAVLWDAHASLALLFYALVLMHVAAGLFHGLVRRDGVFQAMASWGRPRASAPAE